jgi:hypothetical protein
LLHLPSDSTVSEDAGPGIEPRTAVATFALTARRSNHFTRSLPHFARFFKYLRAILCTFQISVDFYYLPVGGRGGGGAGERGGGVLERGR